jgi:tRNA(adenine34) deaminase
MSRALAQARLALSTDDVPVGVVIVRDGAVIAEAANRREADQDPTAHAELLALRQAAGVLGSWRLEGCALYVTLEPCTMCAGALVLARLPLLVYGTADPKAGAAGSLYNLVQEPRLNHRVEVVSGILAEECGRLLVCFFRARRAKGSGEGSQVAQSRSPADPSTIPGCGGVA